MAKGRAAAGWTVTVDGDEGVVACAEYRGRYRVKRSGVVQIIWSLGKAPEPNDSGRVNQAAQAAIAAALRRSS
jgi:uncharacterized protein YcnI